MKNNKYKYSFSLIKDDSEIYTPHKDTRMEFIAEIVIGTNKEYRKGIKKGKKMQNITFSLDMTSPNGITKNIYKSKDIDVIEKIACNIARYNLDKKPKNLATRFEYMPFAEWNKLPSKVVEEFGWSDPTGWRK